jgi:hypothetical protein
VSASPPPEPHPAPADQPTAEPAPTTADLGEAPGVVEKIAKVWRCKVAALHRFLATVAAAIKSGRWRPDELGRHLAHNSPDPADIEDAAGLLGYRLRNLPAHPDECGRRCCAQPYSGPAQPATCIGCRNTIPPGETCVYCEIRAETAQKRAREADEQAEQAAAERHRADGERRRRLDEAMEALGAETCRDLAMARPGVSRKIRPTPGYIRALVADALDELDWDLGAARDTARQARVGSPTADPEPSTATA